MSYLPNWDNTFLSSLKPYRWLRGGKWYLRHYSQPSLYSTEFLGFAPTEWESWGRYGGKSPMSYVVKSEDYLAFQEEI